jgi:HEAT repeat protein
MDLDEELYLSLYKLENGLISVIEALGKIGDPRAVSALAEALGDGEGPVRHEAARALRRIGAPEALRALENHS